MSNITYIIEALAKIQESKLNNGSIKCPKCGGDLRFSKASNGHIRATCKTEKCLSFVQ